MLYYSSDDRKVAIKVQNNATVPLAVVLQLDRQADHVTLVQSGQAVAYFDIGRLDSGLYNWRVLVGLPNSNKELDSKNGSISIVDKPVSVSTRPLPSILPEPEITAIKPIAVQPIKPPQAEKQVLTAKQTTHEVNPIMILVIAAATAAGLYWYKSANLSA